MKWLQNDTNGGLVGFGFAGVLVFFAILVTEWINGPVPDRGQLNRLEGHWVSHRFEHSGRRSFLVVRIRTQQGVVSLIQRDFGDLGAKAARANSDDEVQAWVERRGFKDPVGDLIRYRVWELEAAGQPW